MDGWMKAERQNKERRKELKKKKKKAQKMDGKKRNDL